MNNLDGRLLLTIGVIAVLTVWVNDFMTALVQGTGHALGGRFVHLAIFAATVAYAAYLQYQLCVANRRLAVYRFALQRLPCVMAVARKSRVAEICGDSRLIRLCGLDLGAPLESREELGRTEEYLGPDGAERIIERHLVPLTDFNGGDYAAEFIFDISDRMLEAKKRENCYVKMLTILVNMFEMKDPYSNGHSEAVSNLAQDLAKALRLPLAAVEAVCRAAVLHDIGKIIIPQEILSKSGELTVQEHEVIKAHASVGAEVLAGMEIFRAEAVIVRHHHERFSGGGYPDGLQGDNIPLGARIIAVADAFDAMTAGRSVRGRRDLATALSVLESEKGRQFDPMVVDAFFRLVEAGRACREMR